MIKVIVLFLNFSSTGFTQEKSIDQYLYTNNPELKELTSKKNNLLNSSGVDSELIVSPQLYSNLQYIYLKDRSESPLLINESSNLGSLEVGVKKTNENGSFFRLGHNQSYFEANSTQFLNTTNFSYTNPVDQTSYSGSPFFTFGIPLLSGRGGALIKKDLNSLYLRDKIELLSLETEILNKEIELKNLIWNYSLKKKLISFFQESQSRIKKLHSIMKRKVDSKIEEPGSLYQLDALLKNNEIEILSYDRDLKEITEKLKLENLLDYQLIEDEILTKSIFSSEQDTESLSLSSALKLIDLKLRKNQNEKSVEETKAKLDLIFSANYKNENSKYFKTQIDSFKTKRPEYLVGLSFVMDLDQDLVSKKRDKNELIYKNEESLEKIIKERDLKDKAIVQSKIENEKLILDSLERLRNIQKSKLQNELRLLNLGRSNLFQVLQFETEYTRSEQSYYFQLVALKNSTEQLKNYRFKL
jgi:hypothetical protein